MSRTMTKPKRDHRTTMHVDKRVIEPLPTVETTAEVVGETTATTQGITVPVPRQYAPPACSLCTNDRAPGSNYSRVYATQRTDGSVIRYIRCGHCGNTYKDIGRI